MACTGPDDFSLMECATARVSILMLMIVLLHVRTTLLVVCVACYNLNTQLTGQPYLYITAAGITQCYSALLKSPPLPFLTYTWLLPNSYTLQQCWSSSMRANAKDLGAPSHLKALHHSCCYFE